jgi:hypothetical protein
MLMPVSVNKPSSGSLLLCYAKVMFLKIIKICRYEFSAVVWLHNYPVVLMCVLYVVHSALCTAHSYSGPLDNPEE